jgi:hypothetical protein
MTRIDINADASVPPVDGVTEAWVVDAEAAAADPARRRDRPAFPITVRSHLVVLPGRFSDLEAGVAAHRANGGPAVIRIRPGPGGHGYPLVSWAISPLPEYCAREELALAIDFGGGERGYPWSELVDFARGYPRLAVVALAAPLSGPTAGRALDATANLILDTSAAAAKDAVAVGELAVSRGAYRLAYGTGTARMPVAAILDHVAAADAAIILSGTAGHLAAGTWSATYL